MRKINSFLEQWIKFEVYDTDIDGLYQIHAGISLKGKVNLTNHGFNIYFGNNKSLTSDYYEYGFNTIDSFKRATILSLYYIARITAEKIVGAHIIEALRKGKFINETNPQKYIWEGKSHDSLERWSIFMDLRKLK